MGKKAKEHRKKVARRNEQIKNNQKAFMKAYREAMALQAQMQQSQLTATRPEGNFLELTGAQPE